MRRKQQADLQLGFFRLHIDEQVLKHGFGGSSAAAAVGIPGMLQAVGSQGEHQLADQAGYQVLVRV